MTRINKMMRMGTTAATATVKREKKTMNINTLISLINVDMILVP